jgi:hypothetical protein
MLEVFAGGFRFLIVSVAGVTLALSGCGSGGPTTYPVKGTVIYAGRPVPTGSVTFVPTQGGERAVGAIGGDGSFSLEAAAGEYKVAVFASRESPNPEMNASNWEQAFRTKSQPIVPGFYGDPEQTPLKFSVVADGANLCTVNIQPLRRRRP